MHGVAVYLLLTFDNVHGPFHEEHVVFTNDGAFSHAHDPLALMLDFVTDQIISALHESHFKHFVELVVNNLARFISPGH